LYAYRSLLCICGGLGGRAGEVHEKGGPYSCTGTSLLVCWHVSFGVLARLFWCVGTSLLVCWHVSFGVLARLFVYVMQVSFVYLHVPFVFVYTQVSFVCSWRLGRARGTSTY